MTKREILDRLKQTASYSGDDGRFAFDAHQLDWLQFRAFLRDLTVDVQAEVTPRQPKVEDAGPQPIHSFDDARRRVELIQDWRRAGITDTALSTMLRVLCSDLADAHRGDTDTDADGPTVPASITLIVPPYTPIIVKWGDPSNM